MSDPSTLPLLLYALPPREGHMRPALQIASHLTSQNYDITILGVPKWHDAIIATGAQYAPIIGLWGTLDDLTSPKSRWRHIITAPTPEEQKRRLTADLSHKVLPGGLESVRNALTEIKFRIGEDKLRGRTVVVLSDTCFSGVLPLKLGAEAPPGFEGVEIRTIGIGVVPQFWATTTRPPWGLGLPFDGSEEGVRRNLREYEKMWDQEAEDRARWVLEALNCEDTVDELFARHDPEGAKNGIRHPFHDSYTVCHDVTLQMSIPSLEFPAQHLPPHLKYAGSLPPKPLSLWKGLTYPDWFTDKVVDAGARGKRLVMVAQGTESPDFRELIIPAIQGLANRDNVTVIAILCRKGASLTANGNGEEFHLPSNAIVLDYFPYDAVLAHADVFVSGSGYGGLTHAVANAVPLVQSGSNLDKADIGRRVEYSGLGLYLQGQQTILPEDVTGAVDKLLEDYDQFKDRARKLRGEAGGYDPLKILDREIRKLGQSG